MREGCCTARATPWSELLDDGRSVSSSGAAIVCTWATLGHCWTGFDAAKDLLCERLLGRAAAAWGMLLRVKCAQTWTSAWPTIYTTNDSYNALRQHQRQRGVWRVPGAEYVARAATARATTTHLTCPRQSP